MGYCYGATPVLGLEKLGALDVFGIAHGSMTATDAAEVKVPGMLQACGGCAHDLARLPALFTSWSGPESMTLL